MIIWTLSYPDGRIILLLNGKGKRMKQTTHQWHRKHRKGKRRKGILWDYNWDGAFVHEQLNSDDKKYWRRWERRKGREEIDAQR